MYFAAIRENKTGTRDAKVEREREILNENFQKISNNKVQLSFKLNT